MQQDTNGLNIKELLFLLKRHLASILVLSIIFGLSGFLLSKYVISPEYEADVSLVVNAGQNSQSTVLTYDQLNTAQQLANTCAVILKSDTVLDKVIQNLDLNTTADKLSRKVDIEAVSQTEVLKISVKNNDPKTAAYIANSIAKMAPDILVKIVKASSVEVFSEAKVNNIPVFPNVWLFTAAALVLGLFVSILLSFLFEMLDNTLDSEEDVQKYLDLTVLGLIPDISKKKG